MNMIKRRFSSSFLSEFDNETIGGIMKTFEHLNDEERAKLLFHLGKIYRKGCLQMTLGLHGMVEDCGVNQADMEIAMKIRLILRQIDREYALLLIQDFFEITKQDWWKEQYTPETYRSKKSFAMAAFLHCLYA